MKTRTVFCIILLTTLLVGCKKDEKETVVLMTVDAETVWGYLGPPSPSGLPAEYMQTREMPSGEVVRMGFSIIEGFKYEKGVEYLIKVKKTPIEKNLVDHPFLHYYSLVETISKTKVNDGGDVVSLTVSAEMEWVHLTPEHPRLHPMFMLVKEADADEWERYPFYLFGNLNYEPGFEYLLKVKKSSVEPSVQLTAFNLNFNLNHVYWLIEIVSKTKKTEVIEN